MLPAKTVPKAIVFTAFTMTIRQMVLVEALNTMALWAVAMGNMKALDKVTAADMIKYNGF